MTDGSRRQFLGAAAAAMTLPLAAGGARGEDEVEQDRYPTVTAATTAGHAELRGVDVAATEVRVDAARGAVGVEIENDRVAAHAALLPEDVDALIDALEDARDLVDEARLEENREHFAEYRDD